MKKRAFLLFGLCVSLFLVVWGQVAAGRENGRPPISAHPTDLLLRYSTSRSVLNTSTQAVFGPFSCTSNGDPWSPLVYTWPGSDNVEHNPTYHYRVRVPADYPFDIVRVELFDPDSMNRLQNTATVYHTQAWIDSGRPAVETLSCNSTQQNPCLIDTQEDELLGLPLDQVNPWWFMRIDENRYGDGSGLGCNTPASYNPAYNTQTYYQLYYYQETGGDPARTELAWYTGQVGDGVRDTGDHLTDLQWVSPGGADSIDQPVFVPVDPGSPGTFEVSLSQDLINVVTDPATGDRYIYLDITSLSGSSENGFEIWAGPDIYTNTLSSDVNLRNVQLLNAPHEQAAYGVEVTALDYLPLNSDYYNLINIPLTELGPEYAGQTISISLFDPDSGAQPPIVFYLDSLAFTPDDSNNRYDETQTDWALAFAVSGEPDPDGGIGRCIPGSCQNQWISPTYQIQLPTLSPACDPENPDQAVCTPFYGGRLSAYYYPGLSDTYQWEVLTPAAPPLNNTAGCSAFPVAPYWEIRSLAAQFYPDAGSFDYPPLPPEYSDFIWNIPNVPLTEAQEGYIYLIQQEAGSGDMSSVVWNNGINPSASTLANSLTWPGDSWDYTNHNDGGQPATPLYPWVVRGYVNPLNDLDLAMQVGDWLVANTGAVNSNEVHEALEEHVDLSGRILRLPIWDELTGGFYRIHGFATFRLHGFHLDQNSGDSWLLVEFVQWDESCGQAITAPENTTITGPVLSSVGTVTHFTADTLPISTTVPLTYVWQATNQTPITQTGGIQDAVNYTWSVAGNQTITVTVNNGVATVTDTHTLVVEAEAVDLQVGELQVLTAPLLPGEPVEVQMVISNTGTADLTIPFLVDLFFDPAEVFSDHIPLDYSVATQVLGSLSAGASQVITFTVPTGFATVGEHQVCAMIDSVQQVAEPNETNNVSDCLTVTVFTPPQPMWQLYLPILAKPQT